VQASGIAVQMPMAFSTSHRPAAVLQKELAGQSSSCVAGVHGDPISPQPAKAASPRVIVNAAYRLVYGENIEVSLF
jgi:hypothetical protein